MRTSEVVGGGYADFWNFRGRYRVVKGSRASKKSKTAALWYIIHMMKYSEANLLVVRKTFRTLKDSCFADLKWAANRLGVASYWKITESPLELTYIPTGQKILFRGFDDPFKITSITVDRGCLCWLWIEEAYEIARETDFDTLDESIRGMVPSPLFKQVTLTFNPWNEKSWLKSRFFDRGDNPEILAKTTNYRCNEFLDGNDLRLFERMKEQNPRRYNVAGLGEWGIVEGLVYENWREEPFDLDAIKKIKGIQSAFGLDFGYTNDPTALFCGLVDLAGKRIYVFDELYDKGLTNEAIYKAIAGMGYRKERITADSAEPKSIARLRELGMTKTIPARKGIDSVAHGIDFIQDFEIVVHPRCVNFVREIGNYVWGVDRAGTVNNKPDPNQEDHLMDAMRYALEGARKPSQLLGGAGGLSKESQWKM